MDEKNVAKKNAETRRHKVFTIIGIVLCVILVPMLIINCTLIIKGFLKPNEAPDFAGIVPLIVLSDSMDPDIQEGDLIFTKHTDPEDIQVGDVISFYAEEDDFATIWTHQVIEVIKEDGVLKFRTKGTNKYNTTPDSKLRTADKVIGKYTDIRIAGAGDLAIEMQKPAGLIICVVVPILLFVGYDVIRRKLHEKGSSAEVEALKAELEALKEAKAKAEAESEAEAVTEPATETVADTGDQGGSNDTQA